MSANAFAVRSRAAEGHWFNTEDRLAIVRRLERMVESVSQTNFPDFFPSSAHYMFSSTALSHQPSMPPKDMLLASKDMFN
jgi:hypothetical protein